MSSFVENWYQIVNINMNGQIKSILDIIFRYYAMDCPAKLFLSGNPDYRFRRFICSVLHDSVIPVQSFKTNYMYCFTCGEKTGMSTGVTAFELIMSSNECKFCAAFGCRYCISVDFCMVGKTEFDICIFKRCFICDEFVCEHASRKRGDEFLICHACIKAVKKMKTT